jgi:hypothetical protein
VIYFKNWKEFLPIILCSVIPIVAWHTYHYSNTGWMISTPSSTWESQRSFANPQQIISNIIGITRGFIDYGMLGLSLLFFIALNQFRKIKWNNIEKQLFSILFIVFVGMNGSMIFFSNPIGHRYFMIIHVLMILLIVSRIEQIKNFKVLTLIVFVAFISGHFWLYPNGKSNGWDVTLKYTSYEKNRVQFWNYLIENNISSQEIESAFPLFCSLKQTNLTLGERLLDINEIPQKDSKYIAYSSVCNDMKSFANIDKNPKYLLIQKFGKGTTSISVYKKLEN